MRNSSDKRVTKSSLGIQIVSSYIFPGFSKGASWNQNLQKLGRMKTKRYLMNLAVKKLLPQQEDLSRTMEAKVQ